MDVLGLKTFYLAPENQAFLMNSMERIRVDSKPNQPIIALVVGGVNIAAKLKKIIGNEDIFLARK